jgi:hypothetical protein
VSFPSYQSTTVTDFGADATSHNVNMPATVNAGELLLAIVAFDELITTITTPSGWTRLVTRTPASGLVIAAVYAKVATGSEGGTSVDFVTSNAQRGSAHVIRVTSWAGSLGRVPIAVCAAPITGGSDEVTLVTGTSAMDILWIAAQAKSSSSAWGATPPTGYSNESKTNASEDTTAGGSIASAARAATAAGESVTGWWLGGGTSICSFVIAVLPVGAIKSVRPSAAMGV